MCSRFPVHQDVSKRLDNRDSPTYDIARFISQKVIENGISPKSANRYREIIMRLFTWSTRQRGVRMPGSQNPAKEVERYQERASEISFLELHAIDEQMDRLDELTPIFRQVAVRIKM